ncbi:hypothetical protein ACFL5T_00040 [Gemmatimonadota bacterium]
MKKLFLLFGMLVMVGVLFVACSEQQDPTSPEEALFGKVKPADCDLGDQQALANIIRSDIGTLFGGRKKVKAATEMFNNIERKVCKENFVGAANTAYDFYVMTYGQLPDKLSGDTPMEDAADLVSLVFAFAVGLSTPEIVIPPEALEPTGGVGVFQGSLGGTVYNNNYQVVLKADPNQFPGPDPVVVILTRLPDPDPEVGSPDVIPGYLAFAQAYNIWVNRQPVILGEEDGVLVALCVVEDYFGEEFIHGEEFFDQLVIGHKTSETTGETWTPPIKGEELYALVPDLDCTDATADPPASFLGSADLPTWLQLAGTILEPVAERILDVKPLNAMYFGGRGLGGRGGSLSPIAPVIDTEVPDPVIEFDRVEPNVTTTTPDGIFITDRYYFGVTNWADFPDYLFDDQSEVSCGGVGPWSRTWLYIYDSGDDTDIYGFCVFDSPDDLQSFWFGVPAGTEPAAEIYITLEDKIDENRYVSNTAAIVYPAGYSLELSVTGSGSVDVPGQSSCTSTAGVTTVCSYVFSELGATLPLYATPDYEGYVSDWTGCTDLRNNCNVTPPQPTMTVGVEFKPGIIIS